MTGLMQFNALLFLSAVPVGCSCRLFRSVDVLGARGVNGQQCGDAPRAAE